MKVRRLGKLLGLLVLGAALIVPQGSQAAATPVFTDTLKDTIDPAKHPQNSFRPSVPWGSYQYDCPTNPNPTAPLCNSPWDIATVKADNGAATAPAGKMVFTMTTSAPLAPAGGDPAALGAFQGGNYSWYFQTTMQNAPQPIYTECFGQYDNYSPSQKQRVYLNKWTRKSTCPSTVPGPLIGQTYESTQTPQPLATSTRPADKTVVNEAPHFTADAWWGAVVVALSIVTNFDTNDDGIADFCNTNPATGQDYPQCLNYRLQFGNYEGYSGFSRLEEAKDAFNSSAFAFTVSGSTITATVPYAPLLQSGVDDDLLIDDTYIWPWAYGKAGGTQKMTALVGQVNGLFQAGFPSAGISRFCPSGVHFFPDGAGPAPLGDGQIVDDKVHTLPAPANGRHVGSPSELGNSPNCIGGIFGLLTVVDWAPNAGFELRAFPRSPAYAPSANSLDCRFPVGDFPAPPVPVTLGAMPTGIDASTSPFEDPWTVQVQTHNPTALNPTAVTPPVPVPVAAPNPFPTPIPFGVIGTNTPCGYTFVATGLHYFDTLSPDVVMG